MELRQLRYFVAVADHESFTRAAEALTVAQPALSAQIAKLEDELGARLLERTSRGARLTPTGALTLDRARRVLGESDALAAVARAGSAGEIGRLTIGYCRSFPFQLAADLIRCYHEDRPGVELHLRELGTSAQFDALHEGRIDAGLLRLDDEYRGDDATLAVELARLKAVAFVPSAHRLAGRSAVSLGELAGDAFVMPSRDGGDSYFDEIVAGCREAGFSPRIVQQSPDSRIQLGLVAAGVGVTLLTESAAEMRIRGVRALALRPAHTLRYGLVVRRDDVAGIVRAFVADARTIAKRDR